MKNKEINKEIDRALSEDGNLTGRVTMMTFYPIRYFFRSLLYKRRNRNDY